MLPLFPVNLLAVRETVGRTVVQEPVTISGHNLPVLLKGNWIGYNWNGTDQSYAIDTSIDCLGDREAGDNWSVEFVTHLKVESLAFDTRIDVSFVAEHLLLKGNRFPSLLLDDVSPVHWLAHKKLNHRLTAIPSGKHGKRKSQSRIRYLGVRLLTILSRQ